MLKVGYGKIWIDGERWRRDEDKEELIDKEGRERVREQTQESGEGGEEAREQEEDRESAGQ